MADLFLVRHGQASFGAADYDRLSTLGEDQSRRLGRWFARCGLVPDLVAHGPQRRQSGTARLCLAETLAPTSVPMLELSGLGEFDHEEVIARHRPDLADKDALKAFLAACDHPRRLYQTMYAEAVARWTGGENDADYRESWPAFRARVHGALTELTGSPAQCVVAFTSGGPITAVLQGLVGLPDARAFTLNWPLVNTGMTRLRFSARTGALTLATYNAQPHLDEARDPALVTYR